MLNKSVIKIFYKVAIKFTNIAKTVIILPKG